MCYVESRVYTNLPREHCPGSFFGVSPLEELNVVYPLVDVCRDWPVVVGEVHVVKGVHEQGTACGDVVVQSGMRLGLWFCFWSRESSVPVLAIGC